MMEYTLEDLRNADLETHVWDRRNREWACVPWGSFTRWTSIRTGLILTTEQLFEWGPVRDRTAEVVDADPVNSPAHYQFANGVEVIDLTEQLSFNLGNAVKYAARAGRKTEDPIEDLKKARWYIERELKRLGA